jgi:hypothetical protein
MIVFGAPGSAKTTSVIEPLVTQLLEHCPNQPRHKPALFLLDRKGTLSAKVSSLAARHGRSKDVVVLKLGGPRMNLLGMNSLPQDLSPEAAASGLVAAHSLRQASAHHEEPGWIKTGTAKILTHSIGIKRLAEGEVTLKDLNDLLSGPLRADSPPEDPNRVPEVLSGELERYRQAFRRRLEAGEFPNPDPVKAEFAYHEAFFRDQLVRMNPRNKATLIDALLDLVGPFAHPELAHTFCARHSECTYPGMGQLLAEGRLVVFEPEERLGSAAVTIAILLKLQFQRAALARLERASTNADALTRVWSFIADEYQSFVTTDSGVGAEGDEAFVALSREARIINVFATQSIAGLEARIGEVKLRTLLGAIRTKVFLTLTDPNDCRLASRIAGEDYEKVKSTTFTEANKKAALNLVTDSLQAAAPTVSEQQNFSEQLRPAFLPIAFSRLQTFEAIVCGFDGTRQLPPVKVYLKPSFLPRELPHCQVIQHLQPNEADP